MKADLFVSVHINSATSLSATGLEVLVAGAGGKAAHCASLVLQQLAASAGWFNRGVKIQNVLVLKETSMPAILTENGFISNISDSSMLKDSQIIQSLATAHAKGICNYFGQSYKEQGGTDMLEVAILLNTKEDYWAGADVAVKHDNCAMFVRGLDRAIPKDAKSSKKLIVVGGPTTKHPNEVLLSGDSKYDTAAAVAGYLK